MFYTILCTPLPPRALAQTKNQDDGKQWCTLSFSAVRGPHPRPKQHNRKLSFTFRFIPPHRPEPRQKKKIILKTTLNLMFYTILWPTPVETQTQTKRSKSIVCHMCHTILWPPALASTRQTIIENNRLPEVLQHSLAPDPAELLKKTQIIIHEARRLAH